MSKASYCRSGSLPAGQSFFLSCQQQIQHIGGVFLALHRHVGVDVQGSRRLLMTEEFLHLLDRMPLVDQHAARRMAKIVKADMRQVVLFQELGKSVAHIARFEHGPVRPLADMLGIGVGTPNEFPFFFLPIPDRLQKLLEHVRHEQIPLAGLALGLFLLRSRRKTDNGIADMDDAVFHVHVLPPQAHHLRAPQTEEEAQIDRRFDGIALDRLQQSLRRGDIIGGALEVIVAVVLYRDVRAGIVVELSQGEKYIASTKARVIALMPAMFETVLMVFLFIAIPGFVIRENGMPTLGYYLVFLAIPLIYVVASTVRSFLRAFRKENFAVRKQYLACAIYPIIISITGVLQTLWLSAPFFCFGSTIMMLYVYIISLNDQVSIDELTRLNNRTQLKKYIAGESSKQNTDRSTRYILMIDLNKFKQISWHAAIIPSRHSLHVTAATNSSSSLRPIMKSSLKNSAIPSRILLSV